VFLARRRVGRFQVQPQQRFGVARSEVEPPRPSIDREPVEPILRVFVVRRGNLLDHCGRIVDA